MTAAHVLFLIGIALIILAAGLMALGLLVTALSEEVPEWADVTALVLTIAGGIAVAASHLMARGTL